MVLLLLLVGSINTRIDGTLDTHKMAIAIAFENLYSIPNLIESF